MELTLKYNYFYGFITNGNKGGRPTNTVRTKVNNYIDGIIKILAPLSLSDECLCHRAELLIKLALSDPECVRLITLKDPYNTYQFTTYNHTASDIDLEAISSNLQQLSMTGDDIVIPAINRIILAIQQILQGL